MENNNEEIPSEEIPSEEIPPGKIGQFVNYIRSMRETSDNLNRFEKQRQQKHGQNGNFAKYNKNKTEQVSPKSNFETIRRSLLKEFVGTSSGKSRENADDTENENKQHETIMKVKQESTTAGNSSMSLFRSKLADATNSPRSQDNPKKFDVLYLIQQGVIPLRTAVLTIIKSAENPEFSVASGSFEILNYCMHYGDAAIHNEVCAMSTLEELKKIASSTKHKIIWQKILFSLEVWKCRFINTKKSNNITAIKAILMIEGFSFPTVDKDELNYWTKQVNGYICHRCLKGHNPLKKIPSGQSICVCCITKLNRLIPLPEKCLRAIKQRNRSSERNRSSDIQYRNSERNRSSERHRSSDIQYRNSDRYRSSDRSSDKYRNSERKIAEKTVPRRNYRDSTATNLNRVNMLLQQFMDKQPISTSGNKSKDDILSDNLPEVNQGTDPEVEKLKSLIAKLNNKFLPSTEVSHDNCEIPDDKKQLQAVPKPQIKMTDLSAKDAKDLHPSNGYNLAELSEEKQLKAVIQLSLEDAKHNQERKELSLVSTKSREKSATMKPECCVCLDNEPTHAFVPCGHLCICHDCIQGTKIFKHCLLCRGSYSSIVKVYT